MSFHRNKSLRNLRTNGRLHETFYADVPNQSTLIPSNIGSYNITIAVLVETFM